MTTVLCNTKELNNILTIADMVILDRPSNPILFNARFTVADDLEKMDVVATTLKYSIKYTMTLAEPAPESFELSCPVAMLLKIIGQLDQDQSTGLDFNDEKNEIVITQGSAKYNIRGMSADEFPPVDELQATDDPLLELDTTYLIPALKSSKNHSSKDQTKQTLTATHIEFRKVGNEQLLHIAGTDGRRANKVVLGDIDLDMQYTPKAKTNYAVGLNWNIPRIAIEIIEKFNRMYPQETIKMREEVKDDKKFLIFHLGELMISCESVWGEYPTLDNFITDSGYTVNRLFDKSKLQHTLDRLGVVSDFISKDTPQIFMNISPDDPEVEVRTSEKNILGQGSESIVSTVKDDRTLFTKPIRLSANCDYITQAVRQLGNCSEVGMRVFVDDRGNPNQMVLYPIGFNYQHEIIVALIQVR